jgi:hypothetical protein
MLTFLSWAAVPIIKNSVFPSFSLSLSTVIQVLISLIQFCSAHITSSSLVAPSGLKERYNLVSSAYACTSGSSLLCRPTLAGLGPPRTVCLLWLAIRLPVVCH